MKTKNLREILPEFPEIPYYEEGKSLESDRLFIEEKVDGANVGMILLKDNPIIRNRKHILSKGFIHRKTPAKQQFKNIYNWFYENIDCFKILKEVLGFDAAIYGEWMYAVHSIEYDLLPSYFIAYDIFDCDQQRFMNTSWGRECLKEAGFSLPPLLHRGSVDIQRLQEFCNQKSEFSSKEKREGISAKICDGFKIIDRFKIVRSDFEQGWNTELKRNTICAKGKLHTESDYIPFVQK